MYRVEIPDTQQENEVQNPQIGYKYPNLLFLLQTKFVVDVADSWVLATLVDESIPEQAIDQDESRGTGLMGFVFGSFWGLFVGFCLGWLVFA